MSPLGDVDSRGHLGWPALTGHTDADRPRPSPEMRAADQ
jgi:hypothetical protein